MRDSESSSPIATFLSLIILFAIGFVAVHCWVVRDWVALSTVVAVMVGGIAGYWWGMWRSLASSVGCYAGYALASPTADQLIPFVENQWKQTVDRPTGLLVSGIVVAAAVTLLLIVIGTLLRKNETLEAYDHRAGFLLGVASTSVSAAMIFWVLLAAEPTIEQSRRVIQNTPSLANASATQSIAIERMSDLLVALKKSYVIVALKPWNPIVEVAYLREMKSTIESSLTKPQDANQSSGGFELSTLSNKLMSLVKAN